MQHVRNRSIVDISDFLQTSNQSVCMLSDVYVDAAHQILKNEHAIESLEREIEEHARTIRQIQYKIQQHQVEIRRYKGMITLAKRLPPEILASIFEECVKSGWTKTPLVVSHVCSSWRKAASIPTVWSHVYVNLKKRDPYNRTRLWLERSQDALLYINLNIGNENSQLGRIMTLLASKATRWKEVNIKSVMLHSVNQVLQACGLYTPYLTSISVSIAQDFTVANPTDADGDNHELVALRTAFSDAPLLRHLRIERDLLPGPNIIPSSITHLSLGIFSWSTSSRQSIASTLRLLEEVPLLESLSIDAPSSQMFESDVHHGQLVDGPNLKSLILKGSNSLFHLLANFKASNLSSLCLRSSSSLEQNQADDTGHWIDIFLERSQPPLYLLEIRDVSLEISVYDRILPLLPFLRVLRLHDSDIHDSTLLKLTGPEGLCPMLQFLDLRWCGRLSGQALVDLVHNRLQEHTENDGPFKTVMPLKEVRVINCSFVRANHILELSKLTVCQLIHGGSDDFCCKCFEHLPLYETEQ
jgi:hypothetical protein